MPPKKGLAGKYPSSFCEWVVGTTIENALASRAAKQPPPKHREVVKVEVTTDDETEEDSLKVTYQRSGRAVVTPLPADVVVKKVRFDVAPKKSALKKTAPVSSESRAEASESSTPSMSDESSSEAESSGSPPKKQSKPKRTKKMPDSSDGDADSEPHPTCECAGCVRGRERSKKKAKTDHSQSSATDSEASLSEAGSSPKTKGSTAAKSKAKGAKKSAEESDESQADDEASDSARNGSADAQSKRAETDKNKNESKPRGQKETENRQKEGQKQAKADKSKATKAGKPAETLTAGSADATKDKKQKGKGAGGRIRTVYPEAFPGPHPCRPHLIEPIRAEVVQTERVIERPNDPPPNAYFDPAHGVLRLYHGPVYGSAYGHVLYPRTPASGRPLPIGTPHPTQNPYFHGFNQTSPPPPQPLAHAPYAQAIPPEPYNATYPPPAFDAGHLSGYPRAGPLASWREAEAQTSGTRGAFSKPTANVTSPGSRLEDGGGANNVAPGGLEGYPGVNPYYKGRHTSIFSSYGNQAASNAGQASGRAPDRVSGGLAGDGACGTEQASGGDAPAGTWQADRTQSSSDQKQGSWDTNGNEQQQSGESQEQQSGWTNEANGGTETSQGGGWDNCPADGPPADWGGGDEGKDSAQAASAANSNDVMPGSWVPDWRDPTAAASTGGMVDADSGPSAMGSSDNRHGTSAPDAGQQTAW